MGTWLGRALGAAGLIAALGACASESGREQALPASPTPAADEARASEPVFSPDGTRIAFALDSARGSDLLIMAADGTGLRRLVTGTLLARLGFSADGTRVYYTGLERGATRGRVEVRSVAADGTGAGARTEFVPVGEDITSIGEDFTVDPSGTLVAYTGDGRTPSPGLLPKRAPASEWDLHLSNLDGTGLRKVAGDETEEALTAHFAGDRLLITAAPAGGGIVPYLVDLDGRNRSPLGDRTVADPRVSPDGRRVVFVLNDSEERFEVWSMNLDGTDRRQLTDLRTGSEPQA